MSAQTFPITYFCCGGEMMYVLKQRFSSLNIRHRKAQRVLDDVASAMFSDGILDFLFEPQWQCSHTMILKILDKLAHASIMHIPANSMGRLFQVVIMVTKYQLLLAPTPRDILLVTLNHFDGIKNIVRPNSPVAYAIDRAHARTVEMYDHLSSAELGIVRQTLLTFFQGFREPISIFVKYGQQTDAGCFTIPTGGPVGYGVRLPGKIRFYEQGKCKRRRRYDTDGCEYRQRLGIPMVDKGMDYVGKRGTKLGINMYNKSGAKELMSSLDQQHKVKLQRPSLSTVNEESAGRLTRAPSPLNKQSLIKKLSAPLGISSDKTRSPTESKSPTSPVVYQKVDSKMKQWATLKVSSNRDKVIVKNRRMSENPARIEKDKDTKTSVRDSRRHTLALSDIMRRKSMGTSNTGEFSFLSRMKMKTSTFKSHFSSKLKDADSSRSNSKDEANGNEVEIHKHCGSHCGEQCAKCKRIENEIVEKERTLLDASNLKRQDSPPLTIAEVLLRKKSEPIMGAQKQKVGSGSGGSGESAASERSKTRKKTRNLEKSESDKKRSVRFALENSKKADEVESQEKPQNQAPKDQKSRHKEFVKRKLTPLPDVHTLAMIMSQDQTDEQSLEIEDEPGPSHLTFRASIHNYEFEPQHSTDCSFDSDIGLALGYSMGRVLKKDDIDFSETDDDTSRSSFDSDRVGTSKSASTRYKSEIKSEAAIALLKGRDGIRSTKPSYAEMLRRMGRNTVDSILSESEAVNCGSDDGSQPPSPRRPRSYANRPKGPYALLLRNIANAKASNLSHQDSIKSLDATPPGSIDSADSVNDSPHSRGVSVDVTSSSGYFRESIDSQRNPNIRHVHPEASGSLSQESSSNEFESTIATDYYRRGLQEPRPLWGQTTRRTSVKQGESAIADKPEQPQPLQKRGGSFARRISTKAAPRAIRRASMRNSLLRRRRSSTSSQKMLSKRGTGTAGFAPRSPSNWPESVEPKRKVAEFARRIMHNVGSAGSRAVSDIRRQRVTNETSDQVVHMLRTVRHNIGNMMKTDGFSRYDENMPSQSQNVVE